MTQPPAPTPDDIQASQVIAATTIGLALIAVEARVRQEVDDTIQALYKGLAAATLLAISTAPATLLTGLGLISLTSFHTSTTNLFRSAKLKVADSIRSGYGAAAQVAYAKVRSDLGEDLLPDDMPDLSGFGTLDAILHDLETMFGHAQTEFQNLIATNFDPRDRAGIVHSILDSRTLANRAQAAAGTAVHQGANDALQVLFDYYQRESGNHGLMKRWVVTASDPCGMCAALDGTMVGINAEFDHDATTVEKDYRRVWRNLLAPPRHPNCRCQVELVHT